MLSQRPDQEDLDLLTTTRSFRRRLDLSRPVPREVVADCLDIAVHAPSGSNRQSWRFLALDDPAIRETVARYYRDGFAHNLTGRTPSPEQRADLSSASYLAEHLGRVPVLVIVCGLGRPPTEPRRAASYYGSLYPAVWNFQLALHARGLGCCMTTAHLAYEAEVAELLGIPFDELAQVALLPVAWLRPGTSAPPPRRPAAELTSWNRWSAPA